MVNEIMITRTAVIATTITLLATGCNGSSNEALEPQPPPAVSQRVLLEVDRMTGTQALQDTQTLNDKEVSLTEIYKAGELELRIVQDQSDLERRDSIRLADLHALMTANRNQVADDGEWHILMLIVTEDVDDPGTLGIMFDFGDRNDNDIPREAFAVFESAHEGLPGGVTPEILLTSAHELAHVFNLHHTDWDGTSFQNAATIESYSLTDTVLWRLSDQSIAHLTEHNERLVRPGRDSLPFSLITEDHLLGHQSSPRESYDVIDGDRTAASRSRQRSATVKSRLATQGARIVTDHEPVKLRIEAPQTTYTVGEPVIVSIVLENTGDSDAQINPKLQPEYRFLSVAIKAPQSDEFRPYRTPVIRDARNIGPRTIAPGERFTAEAKLFFSTDGWTFEEPGEYIIRASYPAGPTLGDARMESEELRITVEDPSSEATTTARRLLLDVGGQRLGREQGLYLYMEGGDHLKYGAGKLRELVETVPTSHHASAARLALGNAALNPTYDPTRRTRPDTNLDEAMKYLEGLSETGNLPQQSIERVETQLKRELEKADRNDDANRFRRKAVDKLENAQIRDRT